jgi:heme oxygenase
MNAMMPSVRMRLRAATDQIHQSLHHAAPFAAIAEGTITLADYGATLVFLHRFHAAMLASCITGSRALESDVLGELQAARIAALEQDLTHLGLIALPVAQEPLMAPLVCAGMLYTVQGSTLGGKVIFRQLDTLLPDAQGRTFFRGSAQDGHYWQCLCMALERQDDIAALEAGARRAFARFTEMMPGQAKDSILSD